MDYQVVNFGDFWADGVFCVPNIIAEKYIKLTSEYQLKALLLIISKGGICSGKYIAKALGCTESDAEDFFDFWVEEGLIVKKDEKQTLSETSKKAEDAPPKKEEKIQKARRVESVPVPTLSPQDIVAVCRENSGLPGLLSDAQEVLGKTLSHTEQELIVNMAAYYGLPFEVILTILHFYVEQKKKGRALGTAYVASMAKNWSEEGISDLAAADEKLQELEASDKLWIQIVEMSGIRHRNPTASQRDMIKRWNSTFSMEMIELACNAMRENAERPTLKYVDSVLKNWEKKGIKTPEDVLADNEKHEAKKGSASQNKIEGDPSFDIKEIEKNALYNDNYDL